MYSRGFREIFRPTLRTLDYGKYGILIYLIYLIHRRLFVEVEGLGHAEFWDLGLRLLGLQRLGLAVLQLARSLQVNM